MTTRLAPLLVLGLAIVGCSSSRHFPEERSEAEQAIDRATEAGADKHSKLTLESARDTLAHAQQAEDEAHHDKGEARDQLHAAQARLERSTQRLELKHRALEDELDQKKVQQLALDRLGERRDELRKKGLAEDEIARLTDVETAFANLKLRSIDATLASIEKEIELLELEKKDAQLDIDAANARLATADQRLETARLLFLRAQQQAKVAEAEAVDVKRLGLKARMTEM